MAHVFGYGDTHGSLVLISVDPYMKWGVEVVEYRHNMKDESS